MKKLIGLLSALLLSNLIVAEEVQNDYIIKYKRGNKSTLLRELSNKNIPIRLAIDEGYVLAVRLPPTALKRLANNPAIEYIEEDIKGEYHSQITPYAVSLIQADSLSDNQASGIKVCVIDTGVQTAHEDIDSSLITGSSPAGSGLIWNEPDMSHGTYMAGAILAQNNSVGTLGALPNGYISLHAFRIEDSGISASSVAAGIYDCMANGSNIISMSLGMSKSRTLQTAVQDAVANNILVVASSGNGGDSRTKFYPSAYPEVVAVGAVDKFEQLALYSSTGPHLELVAAGDAVLGLNLMGNGHQAELSVAGDSSYESVPIYNGINGLVSGNLIDCGDLSTACPQASGNICLVQAVKTNQNTDSQGNFNINDQVLACEANGGIGAVFYGDVTEVQYSAYVDPSLVSIPVTTISDTEMAIAYQNTGSITTINVFDSNYFRSFGTSISSPYVASAAALVWSYHPTCTAEDIRQALVNTAKDLGVAGHDDLYGNGLVQAMDAKNYLDTYPCGGSSNISPVAEYSSQCNLLSCDFDASNSTDSDGSIVSYEWDFGDGNTNTGITTSHSYSVDGDYIVTLTVTDNLGAVSSTSSQLSVSSSAIQLSINGYKIKGKAYTDLMWTGAIGTNVNIFRNSTLLTTVGNSGLYTDFVGQRGSFSYQVCESDNSVCSTVQTVNF